VYRESHLRHHDDAHLTDPDLDPESYFVSAQHWERAAPPVRLLLRARNTFIGRVAIGPWFSVATALADGVAAVRRGDWRAAASWAFHLAALGALAAWLQTRCGIGWGALVFGIGYPALALGTIRSFHEHRAAREVGERTVINEAAWPWRLLFLNNNFHAVHHALPGVPWFDLPAVYHRRRDAYLAHNGGFIVRGYREWLLRFAVTAVAPARHPLDNAPEPLLDLHHDDAIDTTRRAWNDRSARLAG
jgi:fatty acid desaturase